MNDSNHLSNRKSFLQKEAGKLEDQIREAPPGLLSCHKNGEHVKWFLDMRDEETGKRKRIYISKKRKDYAKKLAEKTANILKLRDIRKELQAIDSYFRKFDPSKNSLMQLLEKSPGFRELLIPEPSDDDFVKSWLSEEYQKNPSHPEHLRYRTITGELVRSKSEANIYGMLTMNNIPFRYDAALKLGNDTIYPDFTILRMRDRKILYWEHFGRLFDRDYRYDTLKKLRLFESHGFFPGDLLITSYEYEDHPYNFQEMYDLMNLFLK